MLVIGEQQDNQQNFEYGYQQTTSRKMNILKLVLIILIILETILIIIFIFHNQKMNLLEQKLEQQLNIKATQQIKDKNVVGTSQGQSTGKIIVYPLIQTKIMTEIQKELKYNISYLNIPKSRIIQIAYDPGQYVKMPLNPLQLNKEQKKFEEIFYLNQNTRKERKQLEKIRNKALQKYNNKSNILLVKYNVLLDENIYNESIQQNKKDWQRLEEKYKFSSLKTELPFCVVVPGYNNNASFRIEHNLNSIFMQNYTNYKVLIIDDASTDGSTEQYIKYFQFHKIDKKHYTLLSNAQRATALPNIYFGSLFYCSKDSIVIICDGDDEIIGRNTLQLFNWGYQTKKSGVLYSNYVDSKQFNQPNYKFPSRNNQQFTDQVKNKRLYRQQKLMKFHPLNSFRVQLLYQINPQGLINKDGKMFTTTYDWALYMPLFELSCGRVNHIEGQFSYLANRETGLNDYKVNKNKQNDVKDNIKRMKKQECYEDFDQRMKKLQLAEKQKSISTNLTKDEFTQNSTISQIQKIQSNASQNMK